MFYLAAILIVHIFLLSNLIAIVNTKVRLKGEKVGARLRNACCRCSK